MQNVRGTILHNVSLRVMALTMSHHKYVPACFRCAVNPGLFDFFSFESFRFQRLSQRV
ncbi:hypothetical protein [Sulfobacillus thermosulfidooxidans]|uniref:hypothetical protein n=1 Tax=Sulfobacillus thermosulfidooxidans TaxID=28034 RepID=UPI001300D5CB|nr:hypothetical protein [Sulfobacillus thermosulfidooxidans]